jgi:hypothetical protein
MWTDPEGACRAAPFSEIVRAIVGDVICGYPAAREPRPLRLLGAQLFAIHRLKMPLSAKLEHLPQRIGPEPCLVLKLWPLWGKETRFGLAAGGVVSGLCAVDAG